MSNLWTEIALRYAQVSDDVRKHFLFPSIINAVCEDSQRHSNCLDYGCGPGDLAIQLCDLFDSLVLVDQAPSALKEAYQKLGNRASILDPTAFAAQQGIFDVIVLSMVLTTIERDDVVESLLSILNERLSPKGRLIIGTTHPCFTFRALSQVPYGSSNAPYKVPIEPGLDIIEYHRPLERILNLLAKADLRILRTREVYDDPEYYKARGEEPHRFAGLLPMFLVLTCDCPISEV